MKNLKYILIALLFVPLALMAQEDYKDINSKIEYTNPTPHRVKKIVDVESEATPKNIILLIGDGMGYAHFYAGLTANRGKLHIQNMKYMGMAKTHSSDNYTTDSAASGTALASGEKTNNGVIGLDKDGNSIPSILEQAKAQGRATGLVSTSAITHATPASFIAHQPKRSMYEEIAADFMTGDVDVFIGGGADFFVKRTDERNLVNELKEQGYVVTKNLKEARSTKEGKLAVLTAPKHNPRYHQRGDLLPDATKKAVQVLDKNSEEGFFLMVEGSQIDWGGHQNDISYVIEEMLDFDRAVGEALKFAAADGNTLVIVTADHETGGLNLADGNEDLGYVKVLFSSGHHTGIGVPVFAYGPSAKEFMGIYENTDIYHKMAKLWNIE